MDSKRIKVFQQPSRNESMIIRIVDEKQELDTDALAKHYIDREIYVGWPHLRLAKVVSVSDFNVRIEKVVGEFRAEHHEKGNREFLLLAKQLIDQ